jgi:hypothetical protein
MAYISIVRASSGTFEILKINDIDFDCLSFFTNIGTSDIIKVRNTDFLLAR